MQSYSSHPRATVFYHLVNVLSSKSCPIGLLWKISEIIENMIFSLIFLLGKIWYFRQLWKINKIWYLGWAFLGKFCFSCSINCPSSWRAALLFFSLTTKISVLASFSESQTHLTKQFCLLHLLFSLIVFRELLTFPSVFEVFFIFHSVSIFMLCLYFSFISWVFTRAGFKILYFFSTSFLPNHSYIWLQAHIGKSQLHLDLLLAEDIQ